MWPASLPDGINKLNSKWPSASAENNPDVFRSILMIPTKFRPDNMTGQYANFIVGKRDFVAVAMGVKSFISKPEGLNT